MKFAKTNLGMNTTLIATQNWKKKKKKTPLHVLLQIIKPFLLGFLFLFF
jgi:hypothetical protein